MTTVFERAKTVQDLDHPNTLIGSYNYKNYRKSLLMEAEDA
jgi:hypothetical protein